MAACHKWVPLESPVEQTLAEHHGKVRLTLEDGQRLVFDSVRVARDSVFEFRGDDAAPLGPLADVFKAEQRGSNTIGTVLLVSGAVILAGGIFVIVFCASDDVGC
jgi:hypothetical protein